MYRSIELMHLNSYKFSYIHLQNQRIPEDKREAVVSHIVMVHQSVGNYSKLFQQRLRRNNYVTPKNYLDFISSYLKLLDEKDKYILAQVRSISSPGSW